MFKFFAIVFAAILAVVSAGPKPGLLATSYAAPVVAAPAVAAAPLAYSAGIAAPLAYSAGIAAPLAYSGYAGSVAHHVATPFAAPIAAAYY